MEVALAVTLLTALMMPTLRLLTQASTAQKERRDRDELLFVAENVIEQIRIETQNPLSASRLRARGRDQIRNQTGSRLPRVRTRETIAADPTTGNRVLTVQVEAWNEVNRNRNRDADEPSVVLRTALFP